MAVKWERNQPGGSVFPITITDGLLVAVAPGFGYLLVFIYKLAYAAKLGIPTEFIEVGLKDTLVATILVALLLINVMNLYDIGRGWFERLHPDGKLLAVQNAVILSMVMLPWILASRGSWLELGIFLSLTVLLAAYVYLWPLWSQRKLQGYWNKLAVVN